MPKRRTFYWIATGLLLFVLFVGARHLLTGLGSDAVATKGVVVQVGHSTVGPEPYVIVYAYDVPGFPRNGNSGSFTREQITTKEKLAPFKAGMNIEVERSKMSPGASRVKGFGTGNIFWHDLFDAFKR